MGQIRICCFMVFSLKLPKSLYVFIWLQPLPFFLTSCGWKQIHSPGFAFLRKESRLLLIGSQEVGVTRHQRSAESCSQTRGRGPLARKQDHALLQGHVTTKNPPELDESTYSRNGFVVGCSIPTKSEGNF